MLQSTRLRDTLRSFADPDHGSFTAFLVTRDAARHAWADAFDDYFDQVEEAVTGPPPGHTGLVTAGVNGAFFADLGLDPTLSAAAAAADFAGAWKQGVLAVSFAAVTDSSGSVWTPTGFVAATVTSLHAALLATLTALFSAPTNDALTRLGEIADAFHAASSGLVATVSVVSSGGSPLPPVTMGVR
jgi:hypothetical protein